MGESTYIAKTKDKGKRIDVFLSEELKECSRSFAQKLITDKNVKINQGSVKSNYKINPGDVIDVNIPPLEPLVILPEPISLDILYETEENGHNP